MSSPSAEAENRPKRKKKRKPQPSSTEAASRGFERWVEWVFDRPISRSGWWHWIDDEDWLRVPGARKP
ncbi:hypothetical protein ACFL59_03495 [Planctomycetota bacterium]